MNRLFNELKFIVSFNRKENIAEYENSADDVCDNICGYLNVHASPDTDADYWNSKNIINTLVTDDQILSAITLPEGKQLEVDCHDLRVNTSNSNITLPYLHGLINAGKVIIGCKSIGAENLLITSDDGSEMFEITLHLFNVITNDNTLCIAG